MKRILAVVICMLLGNAAHATTTIRILFVVNQAAMTLMVDRTASPMEPEVMVSNELQELNRIFQSSGVDVNFVRAAILTGPGDICCGTATTSDQAASYAASDYAIMSARDLSNADMAIVIGEWSDADQFAGHALEECPSAATAVAGVSMSGFNQHVIAHEVGHLLCATHAKGVQRKAGTTRDDCLITVSVMNFPPDYTFPGPPDYVINEGGLSGFQGHGPTAELANSDMSSNCPSANGQYGPMWTFSCLPAAGSCAMTGQNNFTCNHTRTETYNNPVNGDHRVYTNSFLSYGSVSPTTFECTRVFLSRRFSGMTAVYGGAPWGDAQHDNIGLINAFLPTAAGFHNTKIAPGLPH